MALFKRYGIVWWDSAGKSFTKWNRAVWFCSFDACACNGIVKTCTAGRPACTGNLDGTGGCSDCAWHEAGCIFQYGKIVTWIFYKQADRWTYDTCVKWCKPCDRLFLRWISVHICAWLYHSCYVYGYVPFELADGTGSLYSAATVSFYEREIKAEIVEFVWQTPPGRACGK